MCLGNFRKTYLCQISQLDWVFSTCSPEIQFNKCISFICCLNKLSWIQLLKTMHFIVLYMRKSNTDLSRIKSKCSQGCFLYQGFCGRIFFPAHSGCWQNSIPAVLKLRFQFSLLVVRQGPVFTPRSCPYFSSCFPENPLFGPCAWVPTSQSHASSSSHTLNI